MQINDPILRVVAHNAVLIFGQVTPATVASKAPIWLIERTQLMPAMRSRDDMHLRFSKILNQIAQPIRIISNWSPVVKFDNGLSRLEKMNGKHSQKNLLDQKRV